MARPGSPDHKEQQLNIGLIPEAMTAGYVLAKSRGFRSLRQWAAYLVNQEIADSGVELQIATHDLTREARDNLRSFHTDMARIETTVDESKQRQTAIPTTGPEAPINNVQA